MPISVACPTCGTKLKAPDTSAGKKVKCPKCGILIAVPLEGEEADAGISAAPAPKPKPKQAEDDLDEAGDDAADEPGDEEPGDEGTGKKKKKKDRGPGGPVSEDDKTWGMFAHLAGAFFLWAGALIVFLMKKDESAYLRHHSKESLNFQLTMIIGWVVMVLLSCCIQFGGCIISMGDGLILWLIRMVAYLPFMALGAGNLIMTVLQALKAKNGEWSKYPFAIRLIK